MKREIVLLKYVIWLVLLAGIAAILIEINWIKFLIKLKKLKKRNQSEKKKMNYYMAREMMDKQGNPTGKWKYTKQNGEAIWAVGFCANECEGHATKEEACEHYKQYLLSQAVFKGPRPKNWPKNKCTVSGCEKEGCYAADIPGTAKFYELCKDHSNLETLQTLIQVDWAISSY